MPAAKTITTLTSTDSDTVRTVDAFRRLKRCPTFSEALDKLVSRAARLSLHRLNDREFDRLLDRLRMEATASVV